MTLSFSVIKLRSDISALAADITGNRLPKSLQKLQHKLSAAVQVQRTRKQLAKLDDAALKDIGISRVDALAEARRQPWNRT